MLGFIGSIGCSMNVIDQMGSFKGVRTEQLRDYVREDPERHQLIVFVHGFNSSKDTAWGEFPALLKEDADFIDFNIHRFGFPTKICAEVNDIRNEGQLLASYLTDLLTSTSPKRRRVVLVGHSMGGLVILHALLQLERDQYQLLKDADLKVLTFGTPYLGVENTNFLLLLCDNKQVKDMVALNDDLGQLSREWTQRINQRPAVSVRDTPQIPLYAFRGIRDRLVTPTSACGYPQTPCEVVDGDHDSIVKPTTSTHLAYTKLRHLAALTKIPPTSKNKIGIWVARLTGDDVSHAAQRSIARSLEFFIAQEGPQLQGAAEVRELQSDITGNTLKEKEEEAKRFGKDQGASIMVWGDITRLTGFEELHARVMLIKPLEPPTKTVILAPINQGSQLAQLSIPPGTVRVPPQSVQEPLQLARFVLAMTFMKQQAWAEASRQLEHYINAGLSTAVRSADTYFYAGLAHQNAFYESGMAEPLTKAWDAYSKAIQGYEEEKDWIRYASAQNNLGLIYLGLGERGKAAEANLQHSVETLTDSARRYSEMQNWGDYAAVKSNLGITFRILAQRGVAPELNLQYAVKALKESAYRYKEHKNWAKYAGVQNNLGTTYDVIARRGVAPEANLQLALEALTESARLQKEQQNWGGYATAQTNLGVTYQELASRGMAPTHNLKLSIEALTEAAHIRKTQENWPEYATVQNGLGLTYQGLAVQGVAPEANLQLAVQALTEAARLLKMQENLSEYAMVQNNLGLAYQRLADHGVEPEANLQLSVQALTEGARLRKAEENWAEYAGVQENLGQVYGVLAMRGVAPLENLQHSVQVLIESARLYEEQQNWAKYAGVQNSLGVTYLGLAEHGLEPEANLQLSVQALTKGSRLRKEQENWAEYAGLLNNLGLTYQELADRAIAPEANLQLALQALTEAARLRKEQGNSAKYATVLNNLGLTYHGLAKLGVAPEANLKLALQALTEAARLRKEQENLSEYAGVQNNLGLAYQGLALRGVALETNLQLSVDAFTEAARLYKEHQNWAKYVPVSLNLGSTQEMRASGIDRRVGLEAARQAYENALGFSAQSGHNEWQAMIAIRLRTVLHALIAEGVEIVINHARLAGLDQKR